MVVVFGFVNIAVLLTEVLLLGVRVVITMTVCKVYVASFNRASDGAIQSLVDKLVQKDMYVNLYVGDADVILAVGDRKETFDFVLEHYRKNKPIVHLWAGEVSQGTHDEVYRHSMTLMSMMQLCISPQAKGRVIRLCRSVDKTPNVFVVGNSFLENMEVEECLVDEDRVYDLILYNPPTLLSEDGIKGELMGIHRIKDKDFLWVEPNGDKGSDLIMPFVNIYGLSRGMFLCLLKNCNRFISNSSCMFTEAPLFLKPDQIVPVGVRNSDRKSQYFDLDIGNASDNIINCLNKLELNKRN